MSSPWARRPRIPSTMQDSPTNPTTAPSVPESSNCKTPSTPSSFMTLPPELRTQIYIHYFTPILAIAPSVHQPPSLLSTSQQIRQEALPIYYQHSRFILEFASSGPYYSDYLELSIQEQPLRYWLEDLAPHFLVSIKKLQLRVYFPVCNGTSKVQAAIDIDLETARVILKQIHMGEEIEFVCMGEGWEVVALSKLRSLVEEISARTGPGRLRDDDLVRLHRVLIYWTAA